MRKTVFLLLATSLLFIHIPASAQRIEKEIHELINEYRIKKRRPPLQMNSIISAEAEKHSRNMASRNVPFGHSGFQGRLRTLLRKLPGSNSGAENVAYGNITAEQVVAMWIKSSGHRKNILGDYNLAGIGVAKGRNGVLYFTQIFIRRR